MIIILIRETFIKLMAELVQFAAQIEKVLFADKAFIFHQVMHKDTIEDFKLQFV